MGCKKYFVWTEFAFEILASNCQMKISKICLNEINVTLMKLWVGKFLSDMRKFCLVFYQILSQNYLGIKKKKLVRKKVNMFSKNFPNPSFPISAPKFILSESQSLACSPEHLP